MLGVVSPREPIIGTFAEEIHNTLSRIVSGNLNEEDKKRIEFEKQSRKVIIKKGF